jgi:hypothetical protein
MARGSELNGFQRSGIKLAAAEINLLADELIALGWDGISATEAALKAVPVIVQKRMHP